MDPLGNSTHFTYNIWDKPLTSADAEGGIVRAAYDAAGRMISLTDEKGNVTTFQHDAVGRETRMTYPDGSFEASTFDAAGNVTAWTNRAGDAIAFRYDDGNRMIERTGALGAARLTYTATNRIERITENIGTHRFTYDALHRPTEVVQPNGFAVGYEYDAVGNRTKIKYPGGDKVRWNYDAMNRVGQIVDMDSAAYVFEYDAANRRTAMLFPNGVRSDYGFDAASRLTSLTYTNTTGHMAGPIEALSYTYDAAGNITSRTDRAGTHAYKYDDKHQIDEADYSEGYAHPDNNFDYDPSGNRTTVTGAVGVTSYATNNLNQYSTVNAKPLAYDQTGNLVKDGARTYRYDAANRLVEILKRIGKGHDRDDDGEDDHDRDRRGRGYGHEERMRVGYQYDIGNRILTRTVKAPGGEYGSRTTQYVYDGWQALAEARHARHIERVYVNGPLIDEVLAQRESGEKHFLLRDHLGSTIALTDKRGKVKERYAYDVFGAVKVLDAEGRTKNRRPSTEVLFTGRRLESSLTREDGPIDPIYDYRNRFYSAGLGRFLQVDPIGIRGGINLYTYVFNGPVNLTDPEGKVPPGVVFPVITAAANSALNQCPSIKCKETAQACCNAAGATAAISLSAAYTLQLIACGPAAVTGWGYLLCAGLASAGYLLAVNNVNNAVQNCLSACAGKPSVNPPGNCCP